MQIFGLQKKSLFEGVTQWQKPCPLQIGLSSLIKKEFAEAALDGNSETFVVYVASILEIISIHLAREAQIALL